MKVLLIGSGGREHALAQALAGGGGAHELFCAPGNPGIAQYATLLSCPDTPQAYAELAGSLGAELVVVGPEAPLAAGLADLLSERGIPVFGPSQAAARIESDKAWSKAFMLRHGIPTARHHTVHSAEQGEAAAKELGWPLVVKDAALRAGKGVTIAANWEEAKVALANIFAGATGGSAVLEEFMQGQECTVMALCDGERAQMLPAAQDHKTIFEGDTGPMTGGMGVICPFPLSEADLARVEQEILLPTLRGLSAEGHPFRGALYLGLMLTQSGPKVVEFNCRFGDPEAQAILPLLRGDFAAAALACARGQLQPQTLQVRPEASAVVVLAAAGYPSTPQMGVPLNLPKPPPDAHIFQAGTRLNGAQLESAGGRVLAVQACAPNLPEALARAYALAEAAKFEGAQLRRDIGFRVGLGPIPEE